MVLGTWPRAVPVPPRSFWHPSDRRETLVLQKRSANWRPADGWIPPRVLGPGHDVPRHSSFLDSERTVAGSSFNRGLVTPDDMPDARPPRLTLDVNARRRRSDSTSTMIFDVPHVVHPLSQFVILQTGDVVITDMAPGIGMGLNNPAFLGARDVVEAAIDSLGSQRCVCEPE